MSDLEEILVSLYASAISVSISWIWDGDIDVKLGDPLNGYKAEGNGGHRHGGRRVAARPGRQTLPEQRVREAVRGALTLFIAPSEPSSNVGGDGLDLTATFHAPDD
jgi:hypothetical protein